MDILPDLIFVGIPILVMVWFGRILWVHGVRDDLRISNSNLYNRLPTFEGMLYRFWIWDVVKFIDYGISQADYNKKRLKESKQRGDRITDRYLKSKDPS